MVRAPAGLAEGVAGPLPPLVLRGAWPFLEEEEQEGGEEPLVDPPKAKPRNLNPQSKLRNLNSLGGGGGEGGEEGGGDGGA